jgi:hypothetical protein
VINKQAGVVRHLVATERLSLNDEFTSIRTELTGLAKRVAQAPKAEDLANVTKAVDRLLGLVEKTVTLVKLREILNPLVTAIGARIAKLEKGPPE